MKPARALDALDALVWIIVGACSATLALQLLGGHVGRWVTPAQALTPWVMPWSLGAALIASMRSRHRAGACAAVAAACYLALITPLVFPRHLAEADGDVRLRVVHANLLYSNADVEDTIAALHDVEADVIAVSELTPELASAIDASAIGDEFPYTKLRAGDAAVGLGFWSRFPLAAAPQVPDTTMTLTTGVDVGEATMRLVLTHPLPPLFNGPRWRSEISALEADAEAGRMKTSATIGDFNVSYFHPRYRQFTDRTGMRDVHQAFGRGLTFSWPTDELLPPFVRLDHAVVGEAVTATAIDDVDLPGSDHRAFVVTLAWADAN